MTNATQHRVGRWRRHGEPAWVRKLRHAAFPITVVVLAIGVGLVLGKMG